MRNTSELHVPFTRPPGGGWLALLGGGGFSFGETLDYDSAWIEKTPPGVIGFLPAARGSTDYPQLFSTYLRESFGRELETLPVYRMRDGRREKNAQRVGEVAGVYIGGGVPDHLIEAIGSTPVATALEQRLMSGGT